MNDKSQETLEESARQFAAFHADVRKLFPINGKRNVEQQAQLVSDFIATLNAKRLGDRMSEVMDAVDDLRAAVGDTFPSAEDVQDQQRADSAARDDVSA